MMSIKIGDKFGSWTVIGEQDSTYGHLCRCECGRESTVKRYNLLKGRSTKCKVCAVIIARTTHGYTGTATYRTWVLISGNADWKSFQEFLSDMGEKPAKMALLRKDANKPYSKDNCFWGNHVILSKKYQLNGINISLRDLSELCGVSRQRVQQLLKSMSVEDLLKRYGFRE